MATATMVQTQRWMMTTNTIHFLAAPILYPISMYCQIHHGLLCLYCLFHCIGRNLCPQNCLYVLCCMRSDTYIQIWGTIVDIMLQCYLSILRYIILHTILPTLFFTINQRGSYSAILPISTTYSYFGSSVFTDEQVCMLYLCFLTTCCVICNSSPFQQYLVGYCLRTGNALSI